MSIFNVRPLFDPFIFPCLNEEECKILINDFETNTKIEKGKTGYNEHGVSNPVKITHYRNVDVLNNVDFNDESTKIRNKIIRNVEEQNKNTFQFLIDSDDGTQIGKYDIGQYYNFHVDVEQTTARCRKLSYSINLNEEYDGGELEFQLGMIYKPPIGYATIFPSFLLHKVNEVTKGSRYSLFGWLGGPTFK